MMEIIPVIDLLNGVVVHAKKGERQHYQPIQSSLTTSSEPLEIVSALIELYPFTQLYIADLNAIQKSEGTYKTNYAVIEAIIHQFPFITLWVDAGIRNNTELGIWQTLNIRLVIGSENFVQISNYCALKHHEQNFILSLDFMPHGYQGPAELLSNAEYWPQDVIVMSLAHVGANLGVNKKLLAEIMSCKKNVNFYSAGGVRDADDLIMLKEMGLQGALVATALHRKQISKEALNQL
ncbi:MAG: HisA/HisF-related TIM barrel protein [Methylotenera sp.]|nr:HisA/HisF-related TIM barrel protein [Methylotenera sp.]